MKCTCLYCSRLFNTRTHCPILLQEIRQHFSYLNLTSCNMSSAVRIAPTVSILPHWTSTNTDGRSESGAGYELAQNNTIHSSSFLSLPWKSFPPSPPSTFFRASRPRKAKPPAQLCHSSRHVKTEGICIRDGCVLNSVWPRCDKGSWYGFQEYGG